MGNSLWSLNFFTDHRRFWLGFHFRATGAIPILLHCTISDNSQAILPHVPFGRCEDVQDSWSSILHCEMFQIVCHSYHETLDAFFHAFRDVCLDDLLELYIILCIDYQIQCLNLLFVLFIKKSHLQLLVFVITWILKSLLLHFTLNNFIYTLLLLMWL